MGQPAATFGSQVIATDVHIVLVPTPGGPVPTPVPMPFAGQITGGTVASVRIMGQPAAVVGSTADNLPPHIPAGGPFQAPPANRATIFGGSASVLIGGQQAARHGDPALTCDDIAPSAPKGRIVAAGTVLIGG